ncbi:hypothetical protein [Candidatus Methanomassiliicoccus intestinalis]|uniref:hypothetical protein n=1 Tax=Candidatus Methanomassiliicoccus intestinalis TaxID=1406512 RepID=UPI0037DC1EE7
MVDVQNKSTDAVMGRSGWDVLVQYKYYIMALVAISFYFFVDLAFPGKLAEWADELDHMLELIKPYVVPLLFGAIAGRFVYKRYIFNPIILSVSNAQEGDAEYRISSTYFNRITKINGFCNPIPTATGRIKYNCVRYDPKEKIIDFGWIHSQSVSPAEVFARRESYNAVLSENHNLATRVIQLSDLPMVEGLKVGKAAVDKNLEIVGTLLGISNTKTTVDPDKALDELEEGVRDD